MSRKEKVDAGSSPPLDAEPAYQENELYVRDIRAGEREEKEKEEKEELFSCLENDPQFFFLFLAFLRVTEGTTVRGREE